MTKNGKYLKTVFFVTLQRLLSCNEEVYGGFNSIFGHIFTNIYRKIKTGFYFDFSSLTLPTFAILYFSYL